MKQRQQLKIPNTESHICGGSIPPSPGHASAALHCSDPKFADEMF